MQDETFGLDRVSALVDTRCNVNLEAGIARGARHRQAVKQEGEIFVHDVEDTLGRDGG